MGDSALLEGSSWIDKCDLVICSEDGVDSLRAKNQDVAIEIVPAAEIVDFLRDRRWSTFGVWSPELVSAILNAPGGCALLARACRRQVIMPVDTFLTDQNVITRSLHSAGFYEIEHLSETGRRSLTIGASSTGDFFFYGNAPYFAGPPTKLLLSASRVKSFAVQDLGWKGASLGALENVTIGNLGAWFGESGKNVTVVKQENPWDTSGELHFSAILGSMLGQSSSAIILLDVLEQKVVLRCRVESFQSREMSVVVDFSTVRRIRYFKFPKRLMRISDLGHTIDVSLVYKAGRLKVYSGGDVLAQVSVGLDQINVATGYQAATNHQFIIPTTGDEKRGSSL